MIQHHPSEATLLAHAAGMLPEPHRIVMRTHLALCNDCDPTAHLATELGGVLFDALPPVEIGTPPPHRIGPPRPRRNSRPAVGGGWALACA
jgi:putative transcriptional regulator